MESKDKGIACSFFCPRQALGSVMMKSVAVPCVVFPSEYLAIPGRISNAKKNLREIIRVTFLAVGFFTERGLGGDYGGFAG
jgi:hypothetical protein